MGRIAIRMWSGRWAGLSGKWREIGGGAQGSGGAGWYDGYAKRILRVTGAGAQIGGSGRRGGVRGSGGGRRRVLKFVGIDWPATEIAGFRSVAVETLHCNVSTGGGGRRWWLVGLGWMGGGVVAVQRLYGGAVRVRRAVSNTWMALAYSANSRCSLGVWSSALSPGP